MTNGAVQAGGQGMAREPASTRLDRPGGKSAVVIGGLFVLVIVLGLIFFG